jgi:ABC-type lipoprotein release transport system permease subunit
VTAFAVASLVQLLAITGGFRRAFEERILGVYPHLVLLKRGSDFRGYEEQIAQIREASAASGVSASTFDDMMIAAGVPRAGAMVKGIDLATVDEVVSVRGLVKTGSLDALDETPQVQTTSPTATTDGLVSLAPPVAGEWLTVALTASGAVVVSEDRTPPDPGKARLSVLDLRGVPEPIGLRLRPLDEGVHPEEHAVVFDTLPQKATQPLEIEAGRWELSPPGERLELAEDTAVTLVLLPDDPQGQPFSRLLVERPRVVLGESRARVRYLHAAPGRGAMTFRVAEEPQQELGYGEHTSFLEVPARLPGIILGITLAERLKVVLGDQVTLVTPLRGVDNKMLGPFGMAPSSAHYRVVATLEAGFHEYDSRLALVNLASAQRFLNRGPVIRWIEVRGADPLEVASLKRRVAAAVDPYDLETLVTYVRTFQDRLQALLQGEASRLEPLGRPSFLGGLENATRAVGALQFDPLNLGYHARFRLIDWQEMNTNLFRALKTQRVVLSVLFLVLVLVASFVVVGSQIMLIHERTQDIAILKAIGATSRMVRGVFTVQGLSVALAGVALGLGFGLPLAVMLEAIDFGLDPQIYLIDHLPTKLDAGELVLVCATTLMANLLATQYSARKAGGKSPVEGLRALE